MATIRAREPGWADVLEDHAAQWATARRLVGQLGACEAAALAFCRLLERWARGDAVSVDGRRRARPRCVMRPTASRPRWPGSTIRSTGICSSSSPTMPKAGPGTAGPVRASCSSGSRC